ncbi:MAG: potassium-transporting ATPase subunit KdpC [Pirellulaceae bacterium]|jgi:K+-transporting ATPase ATPase C chain|nr:potassium-transporting ATPase subunit KdpC [Pirellulaceae bacterium]
MLQQLRTSIVVLALLTVLTGVAYPSLVTFVAQLTFAQQANGSILQVDGRPVGSEFVGQPFSRPENFWGRLSATAPFPYNAAASSGSNFGPLHPALVKNAKARIEAFRAADPRAASIPVDLATASGSGLDPHISPAAAEVQVHRVAAARRMTEDGVRELVRQNTEPRQLGVLGEPRVHVLRLNIALDALTHDPHSTRSR